MSKFVKCKCKGSRLHPTEPIGISGFYAPTNKIAKEQLWGYINKNLR